jgi:hypothetical protein
MKKKLAANSSPMPLKSVINEHSSSGSHQFENIRTLQHPNQDDHNKSRHYANSSPDNSGTPDGSSQNFQISNNGGGGGKNYRPLSLKLNLEDLEEPIVRAQSPTTTNSPNSASKLIPAPVPVKKAKRPISSKFSAALDLEAPTIAKAPPAEPKEATNERYNLIQYGMWAHFLALG